MSNTKKPDRKAIYIGRRLNGSKTVHAFLLLPEKKEMWFAGIRGIYIGCTYLCTEKTIARKPGRTDDDRVHNPEWETQDALVDEFNARKRAERVVAKSSKPHLKAAIEALKPLMKGLDYFHRRKLIDYLIEKTR